jgi:hypothetical protein
MLQAASCLATSCLVGSVLQFLWRWHESLAHLRLRRDPRVIVSAGAQGGKRTRRAVSRSSRAGAGSTAALRAGARYYPYDRVTGKLSASRIAPRPGSRVRRPAGCCPSANSAISDGETRMGALWAGGNRGGWHATRAMAPVVLAPSASPLCLSLSSSRQTRWPCN